MITELIYYLQEHYDLPEEKVVECAEKIEAYLYEQVIPDIAADYK